MMALQGVHVACLFFGPSGAPGELARTMGRPPVWSETLATPGTTTKAAPASEFGGLRSPALEITPQQDVFVAIGPAPDAAQAIGDGDKARLFLRAQETRTLFVSTGHRVAWVAA